MAVLVKKRAGLAGTAAGSIKGEVGAKVIWQARRWYGSWGKKRKFQLMGWVEGGLDIDFFMRCNESTCDAGVVGHGTGAVGIDVDLFGISKSFSKSWTTSNIGTTAVFPSPF